jgi:hypothetical protein
MNAPTPELPLVGEPIEASEQNPLADDADSPLWIDRAHCSHCGKTFFPRAGSGGRPQRFCSPECRTTFHAQRSQRSEPHVGENGAGGVEAPPAETRTLTVPRPEQDGCEFDWSDDDVVVLREQRLTAVYRNPHGDLVIRQERSWNEDEDPFLVIAADNVQTLIDKLCDLEGIPSAP